MTAIEWLVEHFFSTTGELQVEEIIKKAKKMEKQQIMEAWLTSKPTTFYGWKNEFEKYYNEKLKK
jgi:hypothetical protein